MSFNDLERGTFAVADNQQPGSQTEEDRQYKRKVQELSRKVFQINAKVANIRQQVSQLGTTRDTSRVRQEIHSKMESTRELIKTTTHELKGLTEHQGVVQGAAQRRARKLEQQKLMGDFQKVVEQFQSVQRVSAEVTREFVDRAKHVVHEEEFSETSPLLDAGVDGGQRRVMELSVLDNEVEYNEALINEREEEIQEIEQGIVELNEIFRDISTMVTEQQSLLDSIETNVQSVSINVLRGAEELDSANEYHRRSSRTKFCLILFLLIFFIVLLLIALS
ncbi:hypothetical protein LPJ56_002343 [Coemansia sp. RSA 2599]|nr:hypothetical protein LPJ75_002011 [Coemansia sp. RSA 2598]KAJ1826123.1 hypothetical protein LPJ56_002343 [Coemansia sp. RSA 2599]